MKEELCALFELTDPFAAHEGWWRWFDAAETSGIPALVKLAELKRSRLDGLAAHAVFPISTGKLEGFNYKIKVAKRIGYDYRDDDYFFTIIRFLAFPRPDISSLNFREEPILAFAGFISGLRANRSARFAPCIGDG